MKTAHLPSCIILAFGCIVCFFPIKVFAQDGASPSPPTLAAPAPLQVVASFDHQPTGVAVSKSGRVFVNFPFWSDSHKDSVVEVKSDQTTESYPNAIWNDPTVALSDPGRRFVCVQSVYVDADDKLWVLDPAAPKFGNVVTGGAKLVKINLGSNTVEKIYYFDAMAAPPHSYLNDVRVDTVRKTAYLTDSGLGAILVLDLNSGKVRRLLSNVPPTRGDPGMVLTIDGQELRLSNGKAFTINSDGLALDSKGETLYFEAPTNGNLYAVATADLRNEKLDADSLLKRVQLVADIGPTDGFSTGPDGAIYVTSVEDHSVKRFDPTATPQISIAANDPRLVWPDSMAWSTDGWLYVTASQIPRMSRFNGGQDRTQLPYQLFRCQPIPQHQ